MTEENNQTQAEQSPPVQVESPELSKTDGEAKAVAPAPVQEGKLYAALAYLPAISVVTAPFALYKYPKSSFCELHATQGLGFFGLWFISLFVSAFLPTIGSGIWLLLLLGSIYGAAMAWMSKETSIPFVKQLGAILIGFIKPFVLPSKAPVAKSESSADKPVDEVMPTAAGETAVEPATETTPETPVVEEVPVAEATAEPVVEEEAPKEKEETPEPEEVEAPVEEAAEEAITVEETAPVNEEVNPQTTPDVEVEAEAATEAPAESEVVEEETPVIEAETAVESEESAPTEPVEQVEEQPVAEVAPEVESTEEPKEEETPPPTA